MPISCRRHRQLVYFLETAFTVGVCAFLFEHAGEPCALLFSLNSVICVTGHNKRRNCVKNPFILWYRRLRRAQVRCVKIVIFESLFPPASDGSLQAPAQEFEEHMKWGAKQRRTKERNHIKTNVENSAVPLADKAFESVPLPSPHEVINWSRVALPKNDTESMIIDLTEENEDDDECCEMETEEAEGQMPNIDEADMDNPLAVTDYVHDIYSFYREREIIILSKCSEKIIAACWVPTPYVFVKRFLKAAGAEKNLEMVSLFLMELCQVEYTMLKYPPSTLAAAAVYTGLCILGRAPSWSRTMECHTAYIEEQLIECAKLMTGFHQNAGKGKLTSVHNKYSSPKFSCAAKLEPAHFIGQNRL